MIDALLKEAQTKMGQAVEHTQGELSTVRTGRANPAILNRVMVDYYGTQTPLQQLASFSVPEPQLLVVQPFDKGAMAEIEKALQTADLGLNPSNDGTVIRIAFPPLNEERRRELIKVARHVAEEGRIAIRNVRRHAKDEMEKLHGEASDDDIRRGEHELQDATDEHIGRLDEMLAHKETDLSQV
ncbi:MAG: ribosome recycling factor [Acidimicrobiia bacterium]|nr:ribosome recycling factor [Acidimicrobiia bacterium]MDH3471934.1 ribosome recycling factor [Acidimicrobiia bacterium]